MKYGSVCSGIEAASVAWHPLGWKPSFFSEIDKFPRAVLAHHYPDVPLHGDFTTIQAGQYAAIDVLVGGTPCQSFSIAGLRKGMDDERGNLALEFCLLARRLGPEWVVWENVPGVLSLDGGRAFASILGGLAECGYGLAYRVLDAQFIRIDGFGRAVPQRRRRVFVVGCLGDWRRAAAVLFERSSLSWDSPPRRQSGERLTHDVAPSLVSSGRGVERSGDTRGQDPVIAVSHTLNAKGGAGRMDYESETLVSLAFAQNTRDEVRLFGEDVQTVGALAADTGMKQTCYVAQGAQGVALRGREHGATAELTGDVMTALRTGGGGGDKPHVLAPTIAFSAKDYGGDAMENLSPTLRAGGFTTSHANAGVMPAIAFNWNAQPDQMNFSSETTPTLSCSQGAAAFMGWRVRRLTPVECERLQGFPDGYTDVPYRGKKAADGPRYKALGNSMACNCMRWIGRRIESVDAILQSEVTA